MKNIDPSTNKGPIHHASLIFYHIPTTKLPEQQKKPDDKKNLKH